MESKSLLGLRAEGERVPLQQQYIRNALATLGHVKTEDQTLAGHLLDAEKALRRAMVFLGAK